MDRVVRRGARLRGAAARPLPRPPAAPARPGAPVAVPSLFSTDYVNTIPTEQEPWFPGDEDTERRYRAWIRWNAATMVHRAQRPGVGVGGHISTYASAASLYEVGFNHFFRGKDHPGGGDHVYIQGHASPGIYARAFLEGRLGADQLDGFRQELSTPARAAACRSYPHPRLMPWFWEFPTVSMGLGPDQRDLPGALQPLPAQPRRQGHLPAAHLGVPRRRRDGRAGVARRHPRRGGRGPRQPDLRRSTATCSAWTGRSTATARSSRSWSRSSAARAGTSSRSSGAASGTGCSHADRDGALIHLMNTRRTATSRPTRPTTAPTSASTSSGATRAPRSSSRTCPTTTSGTSSAAPRLPQGLRRLPGRPRARGPPDGHPREVDQGLHARPALRGPQRDPPDEEADPRGPQDLPRRGPGADQRRRARARPLPAALLPPRQGRPGDPVHARPAAPARWGAARAAAAQQAARTARRQGLRRRAARLGQAGDRHDDGVRPAAQGAHPRRRVRQAGHPDHPRRGPHVRHGLVLPEPRRSTTRSGSSTPRSTTTSCSPTASPRPASCCTRGSTRPGRWPRSPPSGPRTPPTARP